MRKRWFRLDVRRIWCAEGTHRERGCSFRIVNSGYVPGRNERHAQRRSIAHHASCPAGQPADRPAGDRRPRRKARHRQGGRSRTCRPLSRRPVPTSSAMPTRKSDEPGTLEVDLNPGAAGAEHGGQGLRRWRPALALRTTCPACGSACRSSVRSRAAFASSACSAAGRRSRSGSLTRRRGSPAQT